MGDRKRALIGAALVGLLAAWWMSLPRTLFDVPYATVLESREGELLGARIASDGQWRFPKRDAVPHKFRQAVIAFEDERFPYHPGVDPVALVRALAQNLSRREVVSGASTLSMQVVRLSRHNPPRTYLEKLTEMVRATRLEARFSKDEILALWAAHAPFGGNVVGLEAASWRYFGRPPHALSWAESAALAVLPNAPSTILPGRAESTFRAKRDRLLDKLLARGDLDTLQWRLSLLEPLPSAPQPLPDVARHALDRQVERFPEQRMRTSLVAAYQRAVQERVNRRIAELSGNEVFNAAVLVVDLATGEVPVYVGNTTLPEVPGAAIDMLEVPRSTGSILKPFLFSACFEAGQLGPKSLVPDIPTRLGNYTPRNFDREYRGAVTVEEALRRSLNIPAVRVLQDYGLGRFYRYVEGLGVKDLRWEAAHYGLAFILGGAEIRPTQIAEAYYHWLQPVRSFPGPMRGVFGSPVPQPSGPRDAEATMQALGAMTTLVRPLAWEHWKPWRPLAWKTGTSFGHRDAWAVGTDGRWLVVVWTGNADNEGRPGLIGVESSAPLLFEVMDVLPDGAFFNPVQRGVRHVDVCGHSGFQAGPHCRVIERARVPSNGLAPCSFCAPICINAAGERVVKSCDPTARDTSWFVMPASMQWYYRQHGGALPPLPPWNAACRVDEQEEVMAWLYPSPGEVVQRTRDFDGRLGAVVLEVGHREAGSTVFWYDNDRFLGQTQAPHQLQVPLAPGPHRLSAVDGSGNAIHVPIHVTPDRPPG